MKNNELLTKTEESLRNNELLCNMTNENFSYEQLIIKFPHALKSSRIHEKKSNYHVFHFVSSFQIFVYFGFMN